jgi:cytochrome P450
LPKAAATTLGGYEVTLEGGDCPLSGSLLRKHVRSAEIDQRDLPPGPALSPSEQSIRLLREPEEFLAECGRRYGDAFTVRLSLFPPIVFLSHPRAMQEFVRLDRDGDRFRAGEGNAFQLSPLGRHSVLLLDGDAHDRMRRFLKDLWHSSYIEVVRQAVRSTVMKWRPGEAISLREEMERIALDVILRAILGLKANTRRDQVRTLLVRWLAAAEDVPKFLTSFTPLMMDVDDALYEEISRRRREGGGASDLLSRLLVHRDADGTRLTNREIRDQVTTLVAAGHDTTATILAWTFFHLFTEPTVRSCLERKLETVRRLPPTRDLPEEFKRIEESDYGEYLSAVLYETMRLHPVISGVHRMVHRDTRIGRHRLPKGVIVAPCIYLVHRRPDVWRDPDRFDPERFKSGPPPQSAGTYFPFGGGARGCLGQHFAMREMKIVVHEVLKRARLRIESGYQPRATRRGVTHIPDRGIPAIVLAA